MCVLALCVSTQEAKVELLQVGEHLVLHVECVIATTFCEIKEMATWLPDLRTRKKGKGQGQHPPGTCQDVSFKKHPRSLTADSIIPYG